MYIDIYAYTLKGVSLYLLSAKNASVLLRWTQITQYKNIEIKCNIYIKPRPNILLLLSRLNIPKETNWIDH